MSYSFQLKSIHIDVGNGPLFVAVFFRGSSIPSERADAEVRKEKKQNKKRLFTSWLMSVQTSGLYKGTRRNKFNSLKTKLKWIFFFSPTRWPYFFILFNLIFFPRLWFLCTILAQCIRLICLFISAIVLCVCVPEFVHRWCPIAPC